MEEFARAVEATHKGTSPNLDKHSRHILFLGEMIGVSSARDQVLAMLPEATRRVFESRHHHVRPPFLKRLYARALGRLFIKQAVGNPRKAVPVET